MTDAPPPALPRLTAAQAAARLGVKPETLYAYVSRGLLGRERSAAGSSFDPLEVEAFARRRRPSSPSPARRTATASVGTPLMVLDTDIALVEDDELYYRGRPATELAREHTPEDVARWLWAGEAADTAVGHGTTFRPDPAGVAAARAVLAALPPGASALERIRLSVTALGAADPLRHEVSEENLRRVGAELIAGLPRALGAQDASSEATGVAALLWRVLTDTPPTAAAVAAVNTALVLTVDHDLAVSTLAARIAASARADGYAIVTAALGAFDAPLHGDASRPAAELLASVVAGTDPELAIAAAVRAGGRGVPGFGHPLYSGVDARARALLPRVAALDGAGEVLAALDTVAAVVRRRAGLHPNLDLALAALALAGGMPTDAGSAIFAVGRTVGWIAHALDEYRQRPMRLRPRGRYIGL